MSHVAVWMTNYASEAFLPDAIASVLKQSHKDLTLYIADNHSPGRRVAEIIDHYMAIDKRIVKLDVPPGLAGIPLMKFCWDYLNTTQQDYTITIGGHDAWDRDDFLETLVERLSTEKHKPVAIAFPDCWQLNASNQVCGHYNDIMQVADQGLAIIPQYVICGVNSPHLFGLWNEQIRRRVPFRHECSGWDHLVVAEAAMHGMILFEPRARLYMRAPPLDDNLEKYGQRHLSKETLAAGPKDFVRQLEWMIHTLDMALETIPPDARPLYKLALTSAMVGTYMGLRGHNLYTVSAEAAKMFNTSPAMQAVFGGMQHIDKTIRQIVAAVAPTSGNKGGR
jgi:Glycosyl transferase family 2